MKKIIYDNAIVKCLYSKHIFGININYNPLIFCLMKNIPIVINVAENEIYNILCLWELKRKVNI